MSEHALPLVLVGSAIVLVIGTATLTIRPAETVAIAALPNRLRRVAPHVTLLGIVLLANKGLQSITTDVSWLLDRNITADIYAVEGEFVVLVQSIVPDPVGAYLSWTYVVGYAFLLVFPILTYLLLEDDRYARELMIAYAFNYAFGLVLYTLFIAYGPRNVLTDVLQQPLFDGYPRAMLLTSMVNTNTNVFPSLHTSLSVTVVLLAWRSAGALPRWFPIAVMLGGSVTVSTMYLGIHWATDVLAGAVLGVACVVLATRVVGRSRPNAKGALSTIQNRGRLGNR